MADAPILADDGDFEPPSMPTMRGGDPGAIGRIDHYELLRRLGGGGFGVVYLARDSVSGIEVAIKTLHPLLKRNAEEMDLLRGKFKLVHGLTHPNIAKALALHLVRDIDIRDDSARSELKLEPGDSVMVMDYAPGVTLSRWRRQFPGGAVPPDLALEIGRQVAAALDYAHGERVVHRDIKPSNIMVETVAAEPRPLDHGPGAARSPSAPALRVRILDFGLAAEIRSSMSRVSAEKADTSGTRPYMAPEQWLGRRQDGRADQYALACVLYELLSGEPPFAGAFETGDTGIMSRAVASAEPAALPCLGAEANGALARGLAKDPDSRYATCGDLVDAIGKARARDGARGAPPEPGRPSGGERPLARPGRFLGAAAAAACALCALAFLAPAFHADAGHGGDGDGERPRESPQAIQDAADRADASPSPNGDGERPQESQQAIRDAADRADASPSPNEARPEPEAAGGVPRLVGMLLSDEAFARHCTAKSEQRGGTPVLRVAPVENLSFRHNASLGAVRRDLEAALVASGKFRLSDDPAACDYILRGEYRDVADGGRVAHRLSLRLHDAASDLDVWTGSDELPGE